MPNEEISLMTLDYAARTAMATEQALAIRDAALENSALIGKVDEAVSNDLCTKAMLQLKEFVSNVKKAEKAALEGPNLLRNSIFKLRDDLIKEADAEGMRLAGLAGEFQEKERIRLLAITNTQNAQLSDLERQEQETLSKVQTVEEADVIREQFAAERFYKSKPIATVRAAGQSVKPDWEITVDNPYELAKFHPQCVTITGKLAEIKTLLNQGIAVRGVTAKKVTLAGVRLPRKGKALTV